MVYFIGQLFFFKSMGNICKNATISTDYLGKQVTIKIERPLGSNHPKFGWAYPINYGFVPNTVSPDGEELDAYVIGPDHPIQEFTGTCIAVIHRTNDNDDKLIVVSEEMIGMTDDEIRQITDFQEKYFQSVIQRPV